MKERTILSSLHGISPSLFEVSPVYVGIRPLRRGAIAWMWGSEVDLKRLSARAELLSCWELLADKSTSQLDSRHNTL
jgi:hypothetical protein